MVPVHKLLQLFLDFKQSTVTHLYSSHVTLKLYIISRHKQKIRLLFYNQFEAFCVLLWQYPQFYKT